MTPYQAVDLAARSYQPHSGYFDKVIEIGDWTLACKENNDIFNIAIPGSHRLVDFLADSEFLPTDTGKIGLGKIHSGFWKDAIEIYNAIFPFAVGKKISITGHSLGGSRAAILAGLFAVNNIPVEQLFMFEPARPGFQELANIVHGFVPEIIGTVNCKDFVPHMPPNWLGYTHICELIELNTPSGALNPTEDHMVGVVTEGVIRKWGNQ